MAIKARIMGNFIVDVPKYKSGKSRFADNKIKKIKIAPSDTQVTSDKQNGLTQAYGAIHDISLAVLRGNVNSQNGVFYQLSRQEE